MAEWTWRQLLARIIISGAVSSIFSAAITMVPWQRVWEISGMIWLPTVILFAAYCILLAVGWAIHNM